MVQFLKDSFCAMGENCLKIIKGINTSFIEPKWCNHFGGITGKWRNKDGPLFGFFTLGGSKSHPNQILKHGTNMYLLDNKYV